LLVVWAIGLLSILWLYTEGSGGERLRVVSGGVSLAQAMLWVGVDSKTFQKHGLDVEHIMIETGTVGGQVLLAGQAQILHATGTLVIEANLKGADLALIGGSVNRFLYQLISRPEIKSPKELKGKRVAVSLFGSASDLAGRLALEKIQLDPNRDVTILNVGGQNARYNALVQNAVQAAVFTEPLSTLMIKKSGMNLLIDLGKLDIPFPVTAFIVRRSYLRSDRAQVVNFMKAVIEAMHTLKTNRQLGIKTIQKYSRIQDSEEARIAYDYFVGQHMGRIPEIPPQRAFEVAIAMTVGKQKGVTAESLRAMDRSILDEIMKSGFVDSLYK
jgi:NitT/TauT family transport system substrate-binding protein